ncbi:ACT domain-containing protein [Microbacterium foliorum]|uniref:ACT domain-containing protein n=1 Tax=Microbacterium foliorum TaxID=104336 RepID=UPI0028D376D1|nr:ACT domain-containing protein [Microbacterium foliorum]
MPTSPVTLQRLPGEYVVARFPVSSDVRSLLVDVIGEGSFVSITRTPQEISIVCPADSAPPDAEIDGPWAALYVGGPIPFGLTGVVTSLVSPLSAIGCPVFVVSTYDGDVLMVPRGDADRAEEALTNAGHLLI